MNTKTHLINKKLLFLKLHLFRSRPWALIVLPFLCLIRSRRFVWPRRHYQDGPWIYLEAVVWIQLILNLIHQDQLREPIWARILPAPRFANWRTGLLYLESTRNFISDTFDCSPFDFPLKINYYSDFFSLVRFLWGQAHYNRGWRLKLLLTLNCFLFLGIFEARFCSFILSYLPKRLSLIVIELGNKRIFSICILF